MRISELLREDGAARHDDRHRQPPAKRSCDELRGGEKFLLTTHENPDGDALGSLVAMNEMLQALGKDTVMFLSAEEFPLPYEYRDLPLGSVSHSLPADAEERTIVFLDCGNLDRMPVSFLGRDDAHIVNIDHHHDNTRFGTANLVVDGASCTAEIIWELLPDLGVDLTPAIAEALYIGLVTDTGKFQYENTTPNSHRMAGELLEHGVDVHDIFRRLYENVPFAKLQLLARVLNRVERYDGGRLTLSHILRNRLRGDRSGRELLRGHRRPHARAAGHGGGRAGARAAEGGSRGRDEGQPARVGRCGRRERDRAPGGRGRASPGGRFLDHPQPA